MAEAEKKEEMGKEADVICLGQAVVDCIVRKCPMNQTLEKTVGERGEESGQGVRQLAQVAESIRLATGGDAVNESFVLTGLGHKAALACALGEDLAGDILYGEALRRGVDVSRITRSPSLATPIANLMVNPDGSRYSINSHAAMLEGYVPGDQILKGAKIISFASLFRAPLDQAQIVRHLLYKARKNASFLCADTKLPTFRQLTLSDLGDALSLLDYIFPNEKEAAFHTGKTTYEDMAKALHSYGIRHVIIKTGPEGCYASGPQGSFSIPPRQVPVVDTTGAGDSFVAGFLSALLQGASFRECCEKGMDTAAACVQHIGAVL